MPTTWSTCSDSVPTSWSSPRTGPGPGSLPTGRVAGSGTLVVDGSVRHQPAPDPLLTVAFVPTKGDRPEWVTQKLTELGVDRIVPLWSRRSVVRWKGERGERAVDRLRRVAREASAQCRRARPPEVTGVMGLAELAELAGPALCLAHPGGSRPDLGRAVVAVGPEGGWDDDERRQFGATVGLGPTVLRSETAAVAAGTLLVRAPWRCGGSACVTTLREGNYYLEAGCSF